jgi:hypothetical protein
MGESRMGRQIQQCVEEEAVEVQGRCSSPTLSISAWVGDARRGQGRAG